MKKIDSNLADNKENSAFDAPIVEAKVDLTKSAIEVFKDEPKPTVAATIKPEESDEPLLQENPHRFVLFPIKYHEVRSTHLTRACLE